VVALPWFTLWVDGEAEMEKSGLGGAGGEPVSAAIPVGVPRPVGPL
jgi:hypothetical protein